MFLDILIWPITQSVGSRYSIDTLRNPLLSSPYVFFLFVDNKFSFIDSRIIATCYLNNSDIHLKPENAHKYSK